MGRREEAVELLRMGNPPGRVADMMGVSPQTVMGYLNQKVGERQLWRYEILLSVDPADRDTIGRLWLQVLERPEGKPGGRRAADLWDQLSRACSGVGFGNPAEYLILQDAALADMYELIRRLEKRLHTKVKWALEKRYGGKNWWREGVPLKVRKELQCLREEDTEPAASPYNYTSMIHLKEICDAQWPVVSKVLPRKAAANKKAFLSDLTRLNQIRKSVMHPVRGISLRDEDFPFVRSFSDSIEKAPNPETEAKRPQPDTPQPPSPHD